MPITTEEVKTARIAADILDEYIEAAFADGRAEMPIQEYREKLVEIRGRFVKMLFADGGTS